MHLWMIRTDPDNSEMTMRKDKTDASQRVIDDTQWFAMQYVLGEFSDEQTELFESAMADDVTLCEAVFAATQLTCGIALACKAQPSAPPVIARVTMIAATVPFRRPAFAHVGVCVRASSGAGSLT